MRIVVLASPVADTMGSEWLGPDLRLDRAAAPTIVNPNDEHAVEQALRPIEAPLPAPVALTQRVDEPRYASLMGIMGARSKEIVTAGVDELGLHGAALGGDAATTRVLRARAPAARDATRVVRAAARGRDARSTDPRDGRQIGQTGTTVKPALYLTLGVSGALPHTVGMQVADTIVAVNRDPDAPLAEYADLYVANDLFEVGSAVGAELRSGQG